MEFAHHSLLHGGGGVFHFLIIPARLRHPSPKVVQAFWIVLVFSMKLVSKYGWGGGLGTERQPLGTWAAFGQVWVSIWEAVWSWPWVVLALGGASPGWGWWLRKGAELDPFMQFVAAQPWSGVIFMSSCLFIPLGKYCWMKMKFQLCVPWH